MTLRKRGQEVSRKGLEMRENLHLHGLVFHVRIYTFMFLQKMEVDLLMGEIGQYTLTVHFWLCISP